MIENIKEPIGNIDDVPLIGGKSITIKGYIYFGVLLTIGVLVVLCVNQTAGVVPIPWQDEVSYADPVINAVEGIGFTSGAWRSQPLGETWSSNSPLYALISYPILEVFGTTIEVWRTGWAVVFIVTIVTILVAAWRMGIAKSPSEVIVGGTIMMLSKSTIFPVIYGRGIDVSCMLVASCGLLALTFQSERKRRFGLLACGFLAQIAGLQVIPSIVVVVAMFFAWNKTRAPALKVGLHLLLGGIIGTASMMVYFLINGTLFEFVAMTFASEFTTVGAVAQSIAFSDEGAIGSSRFNVLAKYWRMFSWDPSILVASVSAVLGSLYTFIYGKYKISHLFIALIGLLGVPIVMTLAGRFRPYYFWMSFVPIVLYLMHIENPMCKGYRVHILILVLASTIYFGYPSILIVEYPKNKNIHHQLRNFTYDNIGKRDTVMVSDEVYFHAREKAGFVYTHGYSGSKTFKEISKKEKNKVKKLILLKRDSEEAKSKLGGRWKIEESTKVESVEDSLVYYKRCCEFNQ